MAGRTGDYDAQTGRFDKVIYMPCTAENGFVPDLPEEVPDLIYLCFPNNPTGAVMNKAQLQKWVDYANQHDSIILYDATARLYGDSSGSDGGRRETLASVGKTPRDQI